jgi:hypothetical protein
VNPAVVAVAVTLPAAVIGAICWAVGRTGAIRDTHGYRCGLAKGDRKGRVEAEQEIDELRAELAWSSEQIIELAAARDPWTIHHDHEIAGGAQWN